jgi:hypothetical protein
MEGSDVQDICDALPGNMAEPERNIDITGKHLMTKWVDCEHRRKKIF